MKVIIAGGRNYRLTKEDKIVLSTLAETLPITEVVSGAARGADTEGEEWARENGIPVKVFPADWSNYGRAAGPMRNKEMAEYADAAVLFPGGKGTENMQNTAQRLGLQVFRIVHYCGCPVLHPHWGDVSQDNH